MSAESPRRVHKKDLPGLVVLPQTINDPSLIDSVAGFIQEVVPQAYSGDSREVITWVRVQQADINDPALYPDTGEQDGVPPLLLSLGYGTGVQVWSVPATGEAREVLSWSQSSVRSLCILPSPEPRLPLCPDLYKHKRPLVAIVDNAGPGPQFCSVNFISLRDGDQVKSIKFSQQVWDVVANKRSVVITLAERIAVFDASTLEDNLAITTCYPSPDVNPVALGSRWLAYADRRLVTQWRSLGGCMSEGPHSVTATVFHAAKFLGKGLRDLGETVASSLTGSSPDNSHPHSHTPAPNDSSLKGIVTILDIETKLTKDANEDEHSSGTNRFVAHFNAHFEPIVALNFDPSGMLLVSADKRGHRFHVFRINPHPCGPTLAYVQHLYILHRGDTTARVQDIAFSADSRWLAVSSMRGTTHVFPITPYGGPVGVRTHTTPHVVNKLSRFHRSAGLTDDGRNSPVLWDGGGGGTSPPPGPPTHSLPTTVTPLAQVRRQTIAPLTEDSVLRVAACFGAPRAVPLGQSPHLPSRTRHNMDSLYIMASNGSLIQYDLEPRHLSGVTKEKVCDDTGVELHVEVKAEWLLQRAPYSSSLHPPLSCTNPLLCHPDTPLPSLYDSQPDDERWLSQVEIVTHAGPHRRLWMGPQFTFITVNSNSDGGETLDVGKHVVRSNPVNMPLKQPLIIESGSCSSLELSPNMVELVYKTDCSWSCRLREDLAEAMMEAPTTGGKGLSRREPVIERQVNPLGSVVTLTAQLNLPADPQLLAPTDQRKITVVGTEVKKISLESRFNKPPLKHVLGGSLFSETPSGLTLQPQLCKVRDCEMSDSKFVQGNEKNKTNSQEESKNHVKVLGEVNDNIVNVNVQKTIEEKQIPNDVQEKKGKNSKSKRKISKGDKNKLKLDMIVKAPEEEAVEISQPEVAELETEVDGVLQCSGDIEMQLKEASAEKEIEDILFEEDCKGRKRSLDITIDMKNTKIEVIKTNAVEKFNTKEIKSNEKMSSRQRKKSKTNDKDLSSSLMCDLGVECSVQNECLSADKLEREVKVQEKPNDKKKRPKKSSSMNEYEEVQQVDSSLEQKTLLVSTNTIDLAQGKEVLSICSSSLMKAENTERSDFWEENMPSKSLSESIAAIDIIENEQLDINCEENIVMDEKSIVTDDELKGFESDLLVKDSTCAIDINFGKEEDVVMLADKESEKDSDKTKNDETTDKDSSDDCQAVVVKTDSKPFQKKGKNRKLSRKSREIDTKVQDEEMKVIESTEKENSNKLDLCPHTMDNECDTTLRQVNEKMSKNDSEDDEFMDAEKTLKESKVQNNFDLDIKATDGVKKRQRKKGSPEKDVSSIDHDEFVVPVVPKRSWSSVVSINCEDPNGNISKPDEAVLPVRSWSSVAVGTVKSKSIDSETTKTNSVEDRDSVYESCNDSVGEEVEPACDSLGSCYFETENKAEIEEPVVSLATEPKPTNCEKSEDKSNTDSGDKDELTAGTLTTSKKSKKQKKKKR